MKDAKLLIPLLVALSACRAHGPGFAAPFVSAPSPAAASASPTELDYRSPPTVTSAEALQDGRVRLSGRAAPKARVRLASPQGQPAYARAAPDGFWRIELPGSEHVRLFGLAMDVSGRWVQSEGYLALTPRGGAAQLRAGAGALAIAAAGADSRIEAIDFDSKGGVVVSGRAATTGAVDLWVDGARRGRGVAGPDGRVSIELSAPLSLEAHALAMSQGDRRAETRAVLSPPPPLSGGPFRAAATANGWRIDWMTPGGGLQSTLLLAASDERPASAAERRA